LEDIAEKVWGLIRKESSVSKVAKELGIERPTLYHSFKKGAHPRIDTVVKVLDCLGYDLKIFKRKEVKPRKFKPLRSRPRKES
jgi:probable addiction module antidote protein